MKKYVALGLLSFGVLATLIPIMIALIETSSRDIIGGPGLATFFYVFLSWNGGICATVAFLGLGSLAAAAVTFFCKKKTTIFRGLYYVVSVLILGVAFVLMTVMAESALGGANGISRVIGATQLSILIYCVGIPTIVIALMRFSPAPGYVDPYAAAIAPAFFLSAIFLGRVIGFMNLGEAFMDLLRMVGVYWPYFVGLYVFGLMASFSVSRKNGHGFVAKLVQKFPLGE